MKRCIVLLSLAIAQFAFGQAGGVRETWSGIGVPITDWGAIYGDDPCSPETESVGIEFPLESDVFFTWGGLWFGAEIMDGNAIQRRVSTFSDFYSNPFVSELHSTNGLGISEYAHIDTVNCLGEDIFAPYAPADHVFSVEICDTLTDPFFVNDDPVDGEHVPLGLKVELTSYAFLEFCPRVVWVQLHVTNVGQHTLRNLWLGYRAEPEVVYGTWSSFGLAASVGFEHEKEFAYFFTTTGRLPDDTSGNDFISDAAVAVMPLINRSYQAIGFNWWNSGMFNSISHGPAWESYADRDSLGLGWTAQSGEPAGDLKKYQLLTNREQDFDLLRRFDPEWIEQHTPVNQRWANSSFDTSGITPMQCLISAGPYGEFDGEFTWLHPGDSTDMLFAIFGGQGFHDMNHPQPADTIDPDLYNMTELLYEAFIAGESPCFEYLPVGDRARQPVVEAFEFKTAYPNPFNSSVDLIFTNPVGKFADIRIMDVLGREIETVYSGISQAGETRIRWQPKDLASGVYFARLSGEGKVVGVQKLLFVK